MILAIIKKELQTARRDKTYILLTVVAPVTMMLLFGYGFTLDVDNIPLAVLDHDKGVYSREYIELYPNSKYFVFAGYVRDYEEIYEKILRGTIRAALIIPPYFSRDIRENRKTAVQVIIDGSFPNMGNAIKGYMSAINADFSKRILSSYLRQTKGLKEKDFSPIRLEARVWFNPQMESRNFIIPGLLVTTLTFYPALLSTLAVVFEKEKGSLARIISSPLRPHQFLLGKMMAYTLISFVNFLLLLLLVLFFFQIPLKGSLALLIFASVLYIFCTVNIGLLISTLVKTEVAAMLLTTVSTILPSHLYSGFFVPISSMSPGAQVISSLFPAVYYMNIVRGLFLKGLEFMDLWPNYLAIVCYALILIFLSQIIFRKRLV
ncbi:MAG: ABC transporter permease [Candidatus Tectomicrobia bacterium]|uniref:ABC transporter permease n=1 Tax=Tectimicrobiota bacterium TaxID=2528274 RepID=A0A933GKV8_UNCTE|nr:ABC transporter permease [Candidatus Tectomicrobia bacterium]